MLILKNLVNPVYYVDSYGVMGRIAGALVLPRRVIMSDRLPLGRLSGSRMIT